MFLLAGPAGGWWLEHFYDKRPQPAFQTKLNYEHTRYNLKNITSWLNGADISWAPCLDVFSILRLNNHAQQYFKIRFMFDQKQVFVLLILALHPSIEQGHGSFLMFLLVISWVWSSCVCYYIYSTMHQPVKVINKWDEKRHLRFLIWLLKRFSINLNELSVNRKCQQKQQCCSMINHLFRIVNPSSVKCLLNELK